MALVLDLSSFTLDMKEECRVPPQHLGNQLPQQKIKACRDLVPFPSFGLRFDRRNIATSASMRTYPTSGGDHFGIGTRLLRLASVFTKSLIKSQAQLESTPSCSQNI